MAEEAQGAQEAREGAQDEPHGLEGVTREEYDKLLAESRRWEKRAKDNAAKAREYEALQQQSMTDAERAEAATKRAEEAEAKVAEFERRAERASVVGQVAGEAGVDPELLSRMSGDTREEVEANAVWLAKRLIELPKYPSVPDKGQQKAPAISEKDIGAIKDPRERVAARAKLIAQNRR